MFLKINNTTQVWFYHEDFIYIKHRKNNHVDAGEMYNENNFPIELELHNFHFTWGVK